MGELYDIVERIEREIARKQLPRFLTKGRIAIEAGFALGLIDAQTPDDKRKISQLRAAARQVLGQDF